MRPELSTIIDEPVAWADAYQSASARLQQVLKATGRIYMSYQTGMTRFGKQTSENKALSLQRIHDWCDTLEEFMATGGSPTQTRDLSRYYFLKLGVHIDSRFLNTIQNGDIVEVYGKDFKRLFFNPELFDYSSYSPDEMFTTNLWELYRRTDDSVAERLGEFTGKIVNGHMTEPSNPNVGKHIVSEVASERRYSCEVDIKLVAPTYLGRAIVGFVACERFRLILS